MEKIKKIMKDNPKAREITKRLKNKDICEHSQYKINEDWDWQL